MKKQLRDFEKSNQGFTLVELVVAVAMLVLVSIPFALAFITATRVNGTARNKERANTVATSEMEYLRSSDISSLTAIADGYGTSGADVILSKSVTASGVTADEVVGRLCSNGEKSDVMNPRSLNSYNYFRNVTIDGKPFCVEAYLDPFGSAGSGAAATDTETAYYNNSGAAAFPILKTNTVSTNNTSAQYVLSDADCEKYASELAEKFWPGDTESVVTGTGSGATVSRRNRHTDEVMKGMTRTIVFNITNTPDTPVGTPTKYTTDVKASARFTYEYRGSRKYQVLPEQDIYQNKYFVTSGSGGDVSNLKTIYFNYKGNELSRATRSGLLDNVEILNNDNVPVRVYILENNPVLLNRSDYGLGIFLSGGVKWSSVTSTNISDNVMTTVLVRDDVQKMLYYKAATDSSYQFKKYRHITHGSFDASTLMNLSPYNGTERAVGSVTPIYVVHLKVYSGHENYYGDEDHRAKKELIELKSTLQ